jgi:hypothetical protein
MYEWISCSSLSFVSLLLVVASTVSGSPYFKKAATRNCDLYLRPLGSFPHLLFQEATGGRVENVASAAGRLFQSSAECRCNSSKSCSNSRCAFDSIVEKGPRHLFRPGMSVEPTNMFESAIAEKSEG